LRVQPGVSRQTAAIVLRNTEYLEPATSASRRHGQLSPLGWEHIDPTGDHLWRSSARTGAGKFRPFRQMSPA